MKKILFTIQLPPPVHGASMINNVIKSSELINRSFDCDFVNISTSRSIDQIGKKSFIKVLSIFKILGSVLRKLYTKNYDLVFVTLSPFGVGFFKDSFIVLLAKIFRKKIIFHLHGKGIKKYYYQKNFLVQLYYKYIFKNVSIIHLSKSLLFDIKIFKSLNSVHILNNGVEVIDKYRLPSNVNQRINLLFLSNLIESKGVKVLLESVNILKEEYSQKFHVNFVGNFGSEELKDYFMDYIKTKKIENLVSYHGPRYGVEKNEILSKNDIFILPTFNDCFPLSLLEAMQFSLPLISTSEGAIPDILIDGKNGFLVKRKDSKDLAQKIKIFLENEDLVYKMSKNSRKIFLENYTLEIFEKNLLNILSKESEQT